MAHPTDDTEPYGVSTTVTEPANPTNPGDSPKFGTSITTLTHDAMLVSTQ